MIVHERDLRTLRRTSALPILLPETAIAGVGKTLLGAHQLMVMLQ
jgi:hypothetical protein